MRRSVGCVLPAMNRAFTRARSTGLNGVAVGHQSVMIVRVGGVDEYFICPNCGHVYTDEVDRQLCGAIHVAFESGLIKDVHVHYGDVLRSWTGEVKVGLASRKIWGNVRASPFHSGVLEDNACVVPKLDNL